MKKVCLKKNRSTMNENLKFIRVSKKSLFFFAKAVTYFKYMKTITYFHVF